MSSTINNKQVVAVAQLRATSNKFQNLLDVAVCARLAKAQGAAMLFLPECFGFIGMNSAQTLENAEPPILLGDPSENDTKKINLDTVTKSLVEVVKGDKQQPTSSDSLDLPRIHLLDGLRTIARESQLWISAGGMHVSGAPPDEETGNARVYNTHIVVDDKGSLQAVYHKIHLFDVSIPGENGVQLRESASTAPGTKLVVCDSPIGKLGLSTCYDMRFPEMYTALVEQGGAQILLAPSAFTVPTGAAHWHTLLRARAIENQCYVLAAAQYGRHNEKRESFGHSLAVDPWGKILADAGGYPFDGNIEQTTTPDFQDNTPPTIVTCEIDLEKVDQVRQRMPLTSHRANAPFSF